MSDHNVPKIIYKSKTNEEFLSKITTLIYWEFTLYNHRLEKISDITTTQKCIAFPSKMYNFIQVCAKIYNIIRKNMKRRLYVAIL